MEDLLADVLSLETQLDSDAKLDDIDDFVPSEPLPSEQQLDSMLSEIRELEQDENLLNDDVDELILPKSTKDELQAILSSIPAFSDRNKK